MPRTNASWDLTALLNAADARASLPERHLWLVRLLEWLRHAPAAAERGAAGTPKPLLRLRQLVKVLEQNEAHRDTVRAMLAAFWREADTAGLFAEFGFGARMSLGGELWRRLRDRVLPGTPATADLVLLFPLLFHESDAAWLGLIDDDLLDRLAALFPSELAQGIEAWRCSMLDAITYLASAVRAVGLSAPLRHRMSAAALADQPFQQLAGAAERVRQALLAGQHEDLARESLYFRALLDRCRIATLSIREHLEEFGVSVNIVYAADQLRERTRRIELLLDCALSAKAPPDLRRLLLELLFTLGENQRAAPLLSRQFSQLSRMVAERSAETGQHYITRTHGEYRGMLRSAAGGGAVLAGTTFMKFGILAIGMAPFWTGFWSGGNYALSFVIVMLLHWTVATKQPAMTAPAMALKLEGVHEAGSDDPGLEAFVDEVAHLIRSQAAGIFGNLMLCAPVVLAIQLAAWAAFGKPLVGTHDAEHVLETLTLLGPTPIYAAFTGVLLFVSSLLAGWVENWFVFHRLDSAIAWNPRIVARLGQARARRWSHWWRHNISGLAANVSLGMMLGLVPPLLSFFTFPVEVRHVTLSTGQLAAAVGALGWPVFHLPAFWWCVAGIAATGVLNLAVSFWLAMKVALRSRGVQVKESRRIVAAIGRRLRTAPLSFLWPTQK